MKEKEILNSYLGQYQNKKQRKDSLMKRLEMIRTEMNPLKGIDYSSFTGAKSYSTSDMPASYCIKCDELLESIEKERKDAMTIMLRVYDMISMLDADTKEREILELKYIDGCKWNTIADTTFLSRTTCIDYWNKGLAKLLDFERIKTTLEDYAKKNNFL